MASPSRPAPSEPVLMSEPTVEQPQLPSGPEVAPPPSPPPPVAALLALTLLELAFDEEEEEEDDDDAPPAPLALLELLELLALLALLELDALLAPPAPLLPLWMFGWTTTSTVSEALPLASLTVSLNVKIVSPTTGGATHVGIAM